MWQRLKAALHISVGRLDASHHFHHDPDLRIIYDRLKIMNDLFLNRISGEIPEIQNIFYIDLVSGTLGDDLFIPLQDFHHS